MKALLFLNGEITEVLPNPDDFDFVAASDGALAKLLQLDFDSKKIDAVIGDLDSLTPENRRNFAEKIVFTPDQNKTDFHKSLEFLMEKGVREVLIFGANGGELDHTLGNFTTAFHFKDKVKLTFRDRWSTYFFAEKTEVLSGVKGRLISLYPFPECRGLNSEGLQWELQNHHFSTVGQIGTRNRARQDSVKITFESGDYLLFVGH